VHVTRFDAAPEYVAANHFDMRCVRLQGKEGGPSVSLTMACSIIEPGGYIPLSPSPLEKLYLVVEGEVTLSNGEDAYVLQRLDSLCVAPGESREVRNASNKQAMIVLVMPVRP